MLHFESDYTEGAHPAILRALQDTNLEQTTGYGMDHHCHHAAQLIQEALQAPHADIHFLVGGTQTNKLVISSILRPHQGVIAADTAHIAQHESGAIENTGHKVLTLPTTDGKITAPQVQALLEEHETDEAREHTVQPAMLYISWPTELGTLYTKAELTALRTLCNQWQLPLFIDGARMGYGLASPDADLTFPDFARLADVFYIGGTKVGALFGEAIVLCNPTLKQDFRYLIKQQGGMLAKGRLLGLQFKTLFTPLSQLPTSQTSNHTAPQAPTASQETATSQEFAAPDTHAPIQEASTTTQEASITTQEIPNPIQEVSITSPHLEPLYLTISRHAIAMAHRIREALVSKGYSLHYPPQTNLLFILVPNTLLPRLQEKYTFSTIARPNATHTLLRIVTSWATTEEAVTQLIQDL